jgi:uncharacterized protein YdbL (DUF1318 family)
MERKCVECGNMVVIDQTNSHKAIHYKKGFYHYDCFDLLCDKRIAHKNQKISELWTNNKAIINELLEATTKAQQMIYDKDVLNRWLMQQYNISFMHDPMYIKLNSVYKGTYPGLAYPIEPLELHNEWQYYWDELCAIRQSKGIVGESAISYDLVIILSKNAEYRRIKEKEKFAQELRAQQMAEETLASINIIPQVKTKKQSKNKIADLYKEMNGGEGNE